MDPVGTGHGNLAAAVVALGKEHHGGCHLGFRCRHGKGFAFYKLTNLIAETEPSLLVLQGLPGDIALEAAALAGTHLGDEATVQHGIARSVGLPILLITVQVVQVVPADFAFVETEHPAEPPISRKDTTMLVDLEAGRFLIIIHINHVVLLLLDGSKKRGFNFMTLVADFRVGVVKGLYGNPQVFQAEFQGFLAHKDGFIGR